MISYPVPAGQKPITVEGAGGSIKNINNGGRVFKVPNFVV